MIKHIRVEVVEKIFESYSDGTMEEWLKTNGDHNVAYMLQEGDKTWWLCIYKGYWTRNCGAVDPDHLNKMDVTPVGEIPPSHIHKRILLEALSAITSPQTLLNEVIK